MGCGASVQVQPGEPPKEAGDNGPASPKSAAGADPMASPAVAQSPGRKGVTIQEPAEDQQIRPRSATGSMSSIRLAGDTSLRQSGSLNSKASLQHCQSSHQRKKRDTETKRISLDLRVGSRTGDTASALAWPSAAPPQPQYAGGNLHTQQSYIPLDELYVLKSTLGDQPSNLADMIDLDDAAILKEASDAGLNYTKVEHAKEVLFSAVSLQLLLDFAEKVDDYDISTYAVVETVIKPSSAAGKTSYAALLDADQVSRPHYFVSHSWGGNFMSMVDRIKEELRSELPDQVFLWLDIFALNLHHKDRTATQRVKDALMLAKRGTLAVLEPTCLVASCCLFEVWTTAHQKGLRFLKILYGNPATDEEWDEAVRVLDMFACKATKQRDRGSTLKLVVESVPVERLNQDLRVLFSLRPPHYYFASVLRKREWSDRVDLSLLNEWLAKPERKGKTLWVRGPMGTGKSTFYAAVLLQAGVAIGEVSSLQGYKDCAVLAHAVRYNDIKTRSPLRIVRSLAFQLYRAFPDEVGEYYDQFGPMDVWS